MRLGHVERPVESRRDLTAFRHPDTRADNWLAHRLLNNALMVAGRDHASGRLLDIGCGVKPYAPLFAPHVTEHVGLDHPDSPHAQTAVDILATAYEIPLEDESFDTILMTEVLEHLERPAVALAEAQRLLRPGGKVIITAPFVWAIHEEPRDFYRYSPYGLRYLLTQTGYGIEEVIPLGGQWITLALMFGYALGNSPLRRTPRLLAGCQNLAQRAAGRGNYLHFRPWLSHGHLAVASKRRDRSAAKE